MPVDTNKTAHLTRGNEEYCLSRLGMPYPYWSILIKNVAFRATQFQGASLSAAGQKQWCKALITKSIRAPLIVAASDPTDTGAMAVGSWITKHQWRDHKSCTWLDCAEELDTQRNIPSKFIAVHNILADITRERKQKLRDLLIKYRYRTRCIMVAGTKTPEKWCQSVLGLRPSIVLYVKDEIVAKNA